MERKIITVNDFYNVARNNDYFLWHFMKKNQENSIVGLFSFFKTRENQDNKIKEILDLVDIPYFESYTEDSIDFLLDLGFSPNLLWDNSYSELFISAQERFNPILIGFKKFTKVRSTLDTCYCVDGVLDVITNLNPEFLTKINTED